ncbi:malonyl CoA-ACP transacylase [Mycobacterium manitobense]|uniref:Malonyl CoA-ACP transacylase n=1 Tax=[Mycobacterium] manitobense TaxID=190147 RepID=A0A9X2YKL9_9MYCO|nr:malonyl CoA-ACP transacylase [[Mycobacterium] manitobense]MCV7169479.1 malonyl CoA-ACP transacylase [[Mycobacterium] manitobense]
MSVAATVGGSPVRAEEIDEREAALRARTPASALPRPGTSEGRQLRRWLTQLLVTERVVAAEAQTRGLTAGGAPGEPEVLPDNAARLDIGSVAAAVLADALARAVFADVTADVVVPPEAVAEYHARNPMRFADSAGGHGWHSPPRPPALPAVRPAIEAHLLSAARRRAFRWWLDARRAELVSLAPGYEHPGDPRQPDNTHRH